MKKKLSEWAKENAVCYRTAWNYYKKGRFEGRVYVSPEGSIFLDEDRDKDKISDIQVYARVSSNNKKEDLNSQAKLCEDFCLAKGWKITRVFREIASGMNDNRKMLNQLLQKPPQKLVVLHKDRLTRFGFNYLVQAFKAKGCEIVVINENHTESDDLLKDFIAVITSFCCRLYGARRGQAKALKAKSVILEA